MILRVDGKRERDFQTVIKRAPTLAVPNFSFLLFYIKENTSLRTTLVCKERIDFGNGYELFLDIFSSGLFLP